jgi:uncharacterized protein YggE
MATILLSEPVSADTARAAKAETLARLAQLRSELHHRELAYSDIRAELLTAYLRARREGCTDDELSDGAAVHLSRTVI